MTGIPDHHRFDRSGFDAVLLDMNGTFMFGHDRFGAQEDYASTYAALGGRKLDGSMVKGLVETCCETLERIYDDRTRQDAFPSVRDVMHCLDAAAGLDDEDLAQLADVIAVHELGVVTTAYVEALVVLADTHRIGVVSNIWSDKARWTEYFTLCGLTDVFEVMLFSSDGPHIKPSPVLFRQALDALGLRPDQLLFVGDDPRCDVDGARAVGMKTVLVGDARTDHADWQMRSLLVLVVPS